MIDIEVVTPRRAGPVAQALTIMYGNPPLYAQLDIFATVWIPLSARPHRISLRAHDQHSISSNGRVEGYVTLFDSSELPAPSVVGISTSHATLNAELVDDLDRTTNHNRHIASRHRVRISISEQELVDSREEFVFIEGIRTMPEGGQRTETLTIPVTLWAPNTVEAFPNSLTIFNEAPVDVVTRTIFFQGAETEPELVSTIPGVNVDVSNTVKTHGVECRLTLHTKGNNASGSLRFQIDRANIEIPLSIRTFATRH